MSKTFRVVLTGAQRRVVAELLPSFADRLQVDQKNSRMVYFTISELETIQRVAQAATPRGRNGMVRNSLERVADALAKVVEEARGIGAIPASKRLYQFRITLQECQPEIWRRIQIRNCTLHRLHKYIQTAMGWTNSHLHVFEIDGERYGDPEIMDDGFDGFDCLDSTVAKISEVLPRDGSRFRFQYNYDFGDDWEHEILFEGCLQAVPGERYPQCVEGARNCPPEDVGGVSGYAEFLEAIADPDHEEHEDTLRWVGGAFDPEQFDAVKATKAMWRGCPDWRRLL